MPNRTVADYESAVETSIKEVMTKHAALLSRINIPPEAVRTATSLSSLSEKYAIPLEIYNSFIIGAISHLMHEYSRDTGIPPRPVFLRMFDPNSSSHDQRDIASQVVFACDKAQLSELTHSPIQECINDIKTTLEKGLLADNPHPEDNFPNIVKAIANQTAGMPEWKFSQEAMARLDEIETINRLKL